MTAQERVDRDAAIAAVRLAEAAQALLDDRADAVADLLDRRSGMLVRALADTIKDELNILRFWTRDFKDAVDAATSLATLKTSVAAMPTLGDRTLTQLRTAINNRITGGGVDA